MVPLNNKISEFFWISFRHVQLWKELHGVSSRFVILSHRKQCLSLEQHKGE